MTNDFTNSVRAPCHRGTSRCSLGSHCSPLNTTSTNRAKSTRHSSGSQLQGSRLQGCFRPARLCCCLCYSPLIYYILSKWTRNSPHVPSCFWHGPRNRYRGQLCVLLPSNSSHVGWFSSPQQQCPYTPSSWRGVPSHRRSQCRLPGH